MAMEILSAGPLTTVQDAGRTGFAARGFQESGACDKYSMRTANLLAGNLSAPDRAAVLECTLRGASVRFGESAVIALTGADMGAKINGSPAAMYAPVFVREGDTLTMDMASRGLRGYLAVYGGISVPPVMGSRSTNVKCGMGGLCGRALRDGDVLPVGKSARQAEKLWDKIGQRPGPPVLGPADVWLRGEPALRRYYGDSAVPVLRAVAGPQEESFTREGIDAFSRGIYRLTADCNRMACKLEGPAVETAAGADILSDGIVEGSVQVSSNGQPIVMMADHQTTGGYAKIGTVIRVDLPVIAQLRPGDSVGFRFVCPEEGILAFRQAAAELEKLKERMKS